MKTKIKSWKPNGPVVTREEIRNYRRVSTERKLLWLEEMQTLVLCSLTPKFKKRIKLLREKGF